MSMPEPQNVALAEEHQRPLHKLDNDLSQEELGTTFTALTSSAHETDTEAHESILAPADSVQHHSRFSALGKYIKSGVARLTRDAAYYHYGNYVADRTTGVRTFEMMPLYTRVGMHLLYCGTLESAMLSSSYAQRLFMSESIKMGKSFDRPESRAKIPGFVREFHLELGDLAEPDVSRYACFNDFFARGLRPGARPVAAEGDERVVVSAADCRLVVFPTLTLAQEYWIKGKRFSLPALLHDGTPSNPGAAAAATMQRPAVDVSAYEGGSIAIFRLAPQDYHRWHAPLSGTLTSVTDIGGCLMTVNPMAINENLDVYTQNKRSIGLLQTPFSPHPVLICAIGAMLVGSIEWTVPTGAQVKKGQEMGLFKYGGSTVLVITPRDMQLAFDEDLLKNSEGQTIDSSKTRDKKGNEKEGEKGTLMAGACETQVRVGESVARISQ